MNHISLMCSLLIVSTTHVYSSGLPLKIVGKNMDLSLYKAIFPKASQHRMLKLKVLLKCCTVYHRLMFQGQEIFKMMHYQGNTV